MAKKKPAYVWMPTRKAAPKPKVPEAVKKAVQEQCDRFTEAVLKPEHIKLPIVSTEWNY